MNNDLISREALKKAVGEQRKLKVYSVADERQNILVDCILYIIENEPTAYRPKGKWVLKETDYDDGGNNLYECSKCHHSDTHSGSIEVPYCWYCGADMREDEADNETNSNAGINEDRT